MWLILQHLMFNVRRCRMERSVCFQDAQLVTFTNIWCIQDVFEGVHDNTHNQVRAQIPNVFLVDFLALICSQITWHTADGKPRTKYTNRSSKKMISGCNLTVPGNFSGTPSVSLCLTFTRVVSTSVTTFYSRTRAADLPTQTTQVAPSQIGAEHRTDPNSMH